MSVGKGVGSSCVVDSGSAGDGLGGTGGCGSDCSHAFLASCSVLLPSGSNPSIIVWSTCTSGSADANGGVSTGRGGGPSDPALSVMPRLEAVVGGFVASAGCSALLSSKGRDQGSIGSDRERPSRFLDRSGVEVEESEAMSRNLLRRRGFLSTRDRPWPSSPATSSSLKLGGGRVC